MIYYMIENSIYLSQTAPFITVSINFIMRKKVTSHLSDSDTAGHIEKRRFRSPKTKDPNP